MAPRQVFLSLKFCKALFYWISFRTTCSFHCNDISLGVKCVVLELISMMILGRIHVVRNAHWLSKGQDRWWDPWWNKCRRAKNAQKCSVPRLWVTPSPAAHVSTCPAAQGSPVQPTWLAEQGQERWRRSYVSEWHLTCQVIFWHQALTWLFLVVLIVP